MTSRQYARWCRVQGLDADIVEEIYPHSYLILWMECRRHVSTDGILGYPEPEKGYLQQDAEVMLAFEVLEELQEKRLRVEEQRRAMIERTQSMLR